MANYLRNHDRIARLPLGSVIVVHGAQFSITYTKHPHGWVFQRAGDRLRGPSDMPTQSDDELAAQMRFARLELLPHD
jgi:hypothetical protein